MDFSVYSFLIEPFSYIFLKRAFVACFAISLGCAPVGVFLVLRRMSLMGDALSHSILPGAAIGFLIGGLSLPAMSLGGLVAGIMVAILAGLVTRFTHLKEDASFAGFFLLSLALGVMLVSLKGSMVDLMHVLFGTILAVDRASLLLVAAVATLSLIIFCIIYRPLVVECVDPIFFKTVNGKGSLYHLIFLLLVVANLVVAFQALGTLMALGLMMMPAISARFWSQSIGKLCIISVLLAFTSSVCGLLISYHGNFPSGPSIILVAGSIYIFSLLFGKYGSLFHTLLKR